MQFYETKWLVSPSAAISHQIAEALTRQGSDFVNLRPVTLGGLANQVVASDIAIQGKAICSRNIGHMVIESSWKLFSREGYFGRIANPIGLMAAMYQSIMAIKMAGVDPTSISPGIWEDAIKAEEFNLLVRAYQEFLRDHDLLDSADILQMAIVQLQANNTMLDDDWFLFPVGDKISNAVDSVLGSVLGRSEWSELETQLFDCLPKQRVRTISFLANRVEGNDSRVQMDFRWFRSIGDANQVREVFRQCIANKVPLDDVEIILADANVLRHHCYTFASRYFSNPTDDLTTNRLPITFAEGLSASVSRPGRCLAQWWLWVTSGYPQQLLVNMLSDGLLSGPGKQPIGGRTAAALLRPLAIGRGADRYLPAVDEQIKGLQAQMPSDSIRRRIDLWRSLRKLIRPIIEIGQRLAATSARDAIDAAAQFILECSRVSDEVDVRARSALVKVLEDRFKAIDQLGLTSLGNDWIGSLADETRILVQSPQPGCIHVSSLSSGGFSGRKHTYVLGLDDATFPGHAAASCVLLDHEQKQISCHLPTSRQRIENRVDSFRLLMDRLEHGQVTLGWCCYNVAEDRRQYPSPVLLAKFRQYSGSKQSSESKSADVQQLEHVAGPPVSYAPNSERQSLDESELWLHWLSEDERRGKLQYLPIGLRYHHLLPGLNSLEERQLGSQLGPHNGYVPDAGAAINPYESERAFSASSLETLGRCPLAFFFREALRLFPRDEFVQEENAWLDAAQMGSLLHDIFRQFMQELAKENLRPSVTRDLHRLESILFKKLQLAREHIPPPNENAFRSQALRASQAARIFLEQEEPIAATHTATYFEVALGLSSDELPGPLDDSQPVRLQLPNGKSLQVNGRIDRVDQLTNGQYAIWDYKTGSTFGYSQPNPFDQGRHIQGLLYTCMIEASLRKRIDPQAKVHAFGYFFPSIRSAGERFVWQRNELNEGLPILENMCDLISSGYFVATNMPKDCTYCNYRSICRDVAKVTACSGELIENEQLVELRPFRELRRGKK